MHEQIRPFDSLVHQNGITYCAEERTISQKPVRAHTSYITDMKGTKIRIPQNDRMTKLVLDGSPSDTEKLQQLPEETRQLDTR